jgi:3-hydroxyisobutyrate dehydrogenase-like beta-hydroxyacid dehydrogenase
MPSFPPKSNIGLVGLGIIGSRIARVLSHAGHTVWVWNRTPKPVPCFLGSPAEVARQSKYILVFVKDGPALFDVLNAMLPGLTPGHLVASHSTILPAEARQASQMLENTGSGFVDAPFTGSRDAAAAGQLVYYLGGQPTHLQRIRPLLEITAKAIVETGEVGQASLVKIATNMITAASVASLAEALALIEESGVPAEIFSHALENNASCSDTLRMKLPCMQKGDYEPRFSLANMVKDMQLAARLLEENNLGGEQVRAFLQRAELAAAIGAGREDFSAIYRTLHP